MGQSHEAITDRTPGGAGRGGAGDGRAASYSAFLRDVVDLERLAVLPEGRHLQAVLSYDRASRIGDDGTLLDWSANGDAGQFLRQDPEGHVLAEWTAPAASCIWSANPMGTLGLHRRGHAAYLPGWLRGPHRREVPRHPRADRRGPCPGRQLLPPMPYQKHCKVVVENPGSLYYHVNYWTYPAGTESSRFAGPHRGAAGDAQGGVPPDGAMRRALPGSPG